MDTYTPWPCKNSKEQGVLAEQRFFESWANPARFPVWIASITRPTKHEDLREKTDAVIVCINRPNLKIQIKSFPIYPASALELMQYGVIPLEILADHSQSMIRANTIRAINAFMRFTNSQVRNVRDNPLVRDNKKFYRGRVRYFSRKK